MSVRDERGGNALGAEPSPRGERDPIAVFRADGIIEGWIPRLEVRISDGLNDADYMRIRAETSAGVSGWLELDLHEVVAVAAPPRPPSAARLPRLPYAVVIETEPYRVQGTAYLPPGADPDRYLASTSRRWLPLTDCSVTAGHDEWAVDVVVVNLDLASSARAYYQPPQFL